MTGLQNARRSYGGKYDFGGVKRAERLAHRAVEMTIEGQAIRKIKSTGAVP